ncbi:50S ribosomal protein L9 [Patescibacteria group bacterium]|nr:50S ribosomal protein L9 [Patescibacteria group bacterium]
MKVILLQNVTGLGQKDDVKEVKVGYWRNSLLPQGLAIEATESLLKQAEIRKEKEKEAKEYEKKQFTKLLEGLKDQTLVIERKADDTGSLFDGIDTKELAEIIKEKMRFEIPAEIIKLEKPIKKTGIHEVPVGDTVLKVEVKAEH